MTSFVGTRSISHVQPTFMVLVNFPLTVDTLQQDSGECSICLEDMLSGIKVYMCMYVVTSLLSMYKFVGS